VNQFFKALAHVNKIVYEPNQLTLKTIQEEKQNSNYGAGTFQLASRSVRFRVAKKTPNKVGQFVAFWEKDENDTNQPFTYEKAPNLLVINAFLSNDQWGQFIFPKDILSKHDILKTSTTKGKMAIRVYPDWDIPTSKQAKETQKWQLPYFVDLSDTNKLPMIKILELYSQ
jgi:hypothetical protein